MEIEIRGREWNFDLAIESGEVPDLKRRYTRATVFRPTSATIRLVAATDGVIRMSSVILRGPRVLKDGLGQTVRDDYYYGADLPDWLYPVISQAVNIAKADIMLGRAE